MPNLENLKKQAKLVLHWHRARYHPVAAQIRASLPRFAHLTDTEVLAAGFKLGDAQELVARQAGFESWAALKAGLAAMPPNPQPKQSRAKLTGAELTGAEPQLFVTDVRASCDFFTSKLGFSVAFAYGEPPFYGQVVRAGAKLNLRCVASPVINGELRDREDLLSATITVATAPEIKALFLEFQSAGVTLHQTLRKEPWGAKTFIVKDPDGNLLLFAGPAD